MSEDGNSFSFSFSFDFLNALKNIKIRLLEPFIWRDINYNIKQYYIHILFNVTEEKGCQKSKFSFLDGIMGVGC